MAFYKCGTDSNLIDKIITSNGTYSPANDDADGYSSVTVNVPASGGESSTLITKTITTNGTFNAADDNADGYSSVTVNVPTDLEITGTYKIILYNFDNTKYEEHLVQYGSTISRPVDRSKNWDTVFPFTVSEDKNIYEVNYTPTMDIFNHGDVVGWNSDLGFSTTAYQEKAQRVGWTVTDGTLSASSSSNANIVLDPIIKRGPYTKLHVIAEASGGSSGYNYSIFGYRFVSNGYPDDYFNAANGSMLFFTNYSTQSNYAGTSPWYKLEKQECVLDISDIGADTEFRLCAFRCDCSVTIYSIWLDF